MDPFTCGVAQDRDDEKHPLELQAELYISTCDIDSENTTTPSMGHECCSQPAPVAELTASPIRALTEEANVDDWTQDCADDDPETPSIQAPQQTECAASVSNDCCSSGKCEDTETVSNPDTPDCCRGKQSPCCNESCLDRLAMRECGKDAHAKSE